MTDNTFPYDRWFERDNLQLHYLDWGNSGAPSIVLVHGICGNAHYWDLFARGLRHHFHILALDHRGHGDSGWSNQYRLRDYVTDLEYFINSLNLQNPVLIGHSMGGIISAVYTAENPGNVKKMVIVDIGPEIKAGGAELISEEWANEPLFFSSVKEAADYIKSTHPYHSEDYIMHMLNYALKQDEMGRYKFKYDRQVRELEFHSPEWLWDYLKMIVCPTLVVRGTESELLDSEVANRMAATLAFGSVVDIEHAGHTVQGDNPEAFVVAIRRFLGIE